MKLLFAAAFTIFILSALDQADSSAYDKILTHSRIRAKNEGTVLYECCPGYMKLEGMRGCPAVAPIDNVYGTLGLLKAISTQKYSDVSKLREEIEGHGSYTFFAPSNEAWDLLDPEMRSALVSNVNIELYNALHYHMLNKRMLTKDLKNGMTLKSMYNDLGLLINHYPNGVVTVNCARIIHGNQIATNGVVHVIDRVVTAVSNTIQDVIEVEDDLSSLRAAAIASGMLETLGKPGHYTIFAPTNEAFEKLPRAVLERIMSDKVALQALLKFHILDSVQCSEAIMGGESFETLEGRNIEIGCDGESVTINGVKMVKRKDIVTTNGVIHLIDAVLIPDSAKQVLELTGSTQTTFTDLVAQLGLAAAMRPEGEYTLLAPFNGAFSALLKFHILDSVQCSEAIMGGESFETLEGRNIEIGCDGESVTINGVKMVKRKDIVTTNGVIHLIDAVLIPDSAKQVLELTGSTQTTFTDLVAQLGLAAAMRPEGEYTLLAPFNGAFSDEVMTMDQRSLRLLLENHILKLKIVLSQLYNGQRLETLGGKFLRVFIYRTAVCIENSCMVRGSKEGRNGAIHFLRSIIRPAEKSMMEILSEDDRFSMFLTLIEAAGLTEILSQDGDWTLFAPTNDAFDGLSEEEMEILTNEVMTMDQRSLRLLLENHILKLKIVLSQLYNGQRLETLGGKFLRVFIYRTAVCIENSCMVRGSKEGRNGAIHFLRSIIRPAEKSMMEILSEDDRFSMFLTLIEAAGLTEILSQDGDWTLFAPTNDAFDGLSEEEMEILTSDPNALRTILLYHLSNGVFIGGGMEGGVTNLLKSIQGSNLMVKEINNTIVVNEVKVAKNDVMATNGVIHVVNSMLYPADIPVGNDQLLILLKKLIKYIQIKYVQGYRYKEIPMTFFTRFITTEIKTEPEIKVIGGGSTHTITRVIQGEPSITKVTRVIEREPSITKVTRVIQGEPSITKVTRVIQGEPSITKLTRVIEGEPELRIVDEGETFTKVIQGPQYKVTRVTSDGQIEDDETLTKLLEGGTQFTQVSTQVTEGDPQLVEAESERITKLIQGDSDA
ncbi:UNVERIFIED_CONTAM: hypothetical protein FKN15_006213 [Acipenser sinensis]